MMFDKNKPNWNKSGSEVNEHICWLVAKLRERYGYVEQRRCDPQLLPDEQRWEGGYEHVNGEDYKNRVAKQ